VHLQQRGLKLLIARRSVLTHVITIIEHAPRVPRFHWLAHRNTQFVAPVGPLIAPQLYFKRVCVFSFRGSCENRVVQERRVVVVLLANQHCILGEIVSRITPGYFANVNGMKYFYGGPPPENIATWKSVDPSVTISFRVQPLSPQPSCSSPLR